MLTPKPDELQYLVFVQKQAALVEIPPILVYPSYKRIVLSPKRGDQAGGHFEKRALANPARARKGRDAG
jgi:succinyl-CoA synthetase beta subunit